MPLKYHSAKYTYGYEMRENRTEELVEMGTFLNLHTSVYKEVIRNRHKLPRIVKTINNHKKDVEKCDKHGYQNQKW